MKVINFLQVTSDYFNDLVSYKPDILFTSDLLNVNNDCIVFYDRKELLDKNTFEFTIFGYCIIDYSRIESVDILRAIKLNFQYYLDRFAEIFKNKKSGVYHKLLRITGYSEPVIFENSIKNIDKAAVFQRLFELEHLEYRNSYNIYLE